VLELRDGEIRPHTIDPAQLGIIAAPIEAIRGGEPSENAAIARRTLAGEPGPVREVVTLNAAAGLFVGEAVASMAEGVALARAVLDDGRATAVLDQLIAATGGHPAPV
jgi:anthranilate phosphoribosyltransferase